MVRKSLAILFLLELFLRTTDVDGQGYPPVYCPPNRPPQYAFPYARTTPLQTLLFVRLAGPDGMKATFFRGPNQAVTLNTPCVVGMRPGYFYRIAVSGMKRFPGQTFFPTLEVRGSLLLGGNLRASDYPAGLLFKEDDFAQAQEGFFRRKVIFVEKVENALPEASSPDSPLEVIVPKDQDPLSEARERGLPVMIVELGSRDFATEDLLRQAIPGTILLPGDAYLPRPSVIPCLPWSCFPIYDPLLGPAPWLYYTLPDGGDWGPRAGYDRYGRLVGLDPADTLVEYQNSKGQKQIAASNRVCLCIPRFLVARNEAGLRPLFVGAPFSPQQAETKLTQQAMDSRRIPQELERDRHLELVREKLKAAGIEKTQVTAVTGRVQNLDVTATISGPTNVTGSMPPKLGPEKEGADVPLKVDKWPDRCGGVVGAIITFTIRYMNVGQQPITNVVVSDNLISRFEYVTGSNKTSRAATFTAQPNNVGSTIVRWEIDGTLKPGETGTVNFQVRIR